MKYNKNDPNIYAVNRRFRKSFTNRNGICHRQQIILLLS